ncbi:MAG: NADP-dependent oxidoreductase [Deltaproteobacteria bacterium]|nr:NADP-dependent oxidoreductase [Deltaproteobacteria bacterium]
MKVIRIHRYGSLDVMKYEEVLVSKPGKGEVLLRVHAAGVNPADAKIREGEAFASLYPFYKDPFPFILGWDVSGVVSQIGAGVTGFNIGDEVYGMVNFPYEGGAYAEYVTAPATHLAIKPVSLSHIEAAALPLAALTAWQALFGAAGLSGGESVLIHAAAGGVGHLAVQLAKWKGASRIIGTAASNDTAYLQTIGVDEVIDYMTANFEDTVKDVDIVMDCVGGEVQENSWQVLKKGGFLVTIMEPPPKEKAEAFGVRAERIFVKADAGDLKEIAQVVDAGKLVPYIYRVFPLREAREAHELLEKGQTRGKIVLSIVD